MKKKAANQKEPKKSEPHQSEPDCLELLGEFVRAFQSIPQRYCLFCEANAALGIEAHRADCPFLRASELIKTKSNDPQ